MEKITFKNEELKNVAKLLLENNYKVLYYTKEGDKEKKTWLIFSIDNQIGYVQAEYSGVTISTIHKPCKECGTGFGVTEDAIINTTLDNLNEAFITAPNWAKRKIDAVKKYKDIEEYKNRDGLKYEYLTLDQI